MSLYKLVFLTLFLVNVYIRLSIQIKPQQRLKQFQLQ